MFFCLGRAIRFILLWQSSDHPGEAVTPVRVHRRASRPFQAGVGRVPAGRAHDRQVARPVVTGGMTELGAVWTGIHSAIVARERREAEVALARESREPPAPAARNVEVEPLPQTDPLPI